MAPFRNERVYIMGKRSHLGYQHEPVIHLEAVGHEASDIGTKTNGKPRQDQKKNSGGLEVVAIVLGEDNMTITCHGNGPGESVIGPDAYSSTKRPRE